MPRKKPNKNNDQPAKKRAKPKIKLAAAHISELVSKNGINNLFMKTDISSLVAFRIFFGVLMCYECIVYLVKEGWIYSYWVQDLMHFTYWPFDFIKPLPGNGMYILFICLAILGILIAVGFLYRICTILFFLAFTYVFLIEETTYLNHFYLICLVSFLLIFVPANRSLSVDAKIFKSIRSEVTSTWSVWLLRFMIGVPYFFGGIAKMKYDWLHGQPMGIWMANEDMPLIGQFFDQDWMILFMSYAGLILDLFVVPALLFRKTRVAAFIFITIFHLMNAHIFVIGIFPWFMIAATTIFFDPDWFRKLLQKIIKSKSYWKMALPNAIVSKSSFGLNLKQKMIVSLLGIWLLLHIAIPLRHFFIPGNVTWTEEGYYFSWHMMLRDKKRHCNIHYGK